MTVKDFVEGLMKDFGLVGLVLIDELLATIEDLKVVIPFEDFMDGLMGVKNLKFTDYLWEQKT